MFMFDSRSVNDKFVMAIDLGKNKLDQTDIAKILKDTGASEINIKEIE